MRGAMRANTVFLTVLFVFLWNSGFIGAEYSLPYAGPFTHLFWRYAVLSLILLAYLAIRRRLHWPGWSTTLFEAAVGILAHAVWLGCCLVAIQRGVPAGIVALVVALQPLATGTLSGAVVGERTPLPNWIGLIVGFSGVALTVLGRTRLGGSASLPAYLIPLGAVVAMTVATLLQRYREVHDRSPLPPLDITLLCQSLGTVLVVAVPAAALERLATEWRPAFLASMAWLVLVVSLAAYALLFVLLHRMDATRVSSLFYLGPPVTMLMAWAAFGDAIRGTDLAGLAIVCIGVALAQRPNRSQELVASERPERPATGRPRG